jgi:predicted N-formylglutamate amidohydrolase
MGGRCRFLDSDEGAAYEVINAGGRAPVLLVCEHASNRFPRRLNALGLSEELQKSHIAWDPGALGVARFLARRLDARLVAARFSRLVYDCNRPPEAPDAIAETGEFGPVPGNAGLSQEDRAERVRCLYEPFQQAVTAELDRLREAGAEPVLVTVHSFTPIYRGHSREVQIGVLHDEDARLADELLRLLPGRCGYRIGRNDPYGPEDGVTHTLRRQALPRGLKNVMLEIRNDLIAEEPAQDAMAGLLAGALAQALPGIRLVNHPTGGG